MKSKRYAISCRFEREACATTYCPFPTHSRPDGADWINRHIASGVKFSPKIALISNGTGKRADGLQITTADYWVRHIRETVRFCDSIKTVWEEGHEVFLEIGHSVLSGLGKRCIPGKRGCGSLPGAWRGRLEADIVLLITVVRVWDGS